MGKTMRAIRVKNFGPTSVLEVAEINIPQISNSKILVKVKAAGVNPVDTYIREGAFSNLPDLPYTPGKDGAGIIQDLGENVTQFQVGQRVFFCGRKLGSCGTYAEYCLLDDIDTFPLDDSLTFDEGAALGVPYFTAFRALVLKAKCNPGETVLVHGASGGVGLAAIQLAKAKNLKVIGTAGTQDGMKLVKENGSDFVICHREKNYQQKIMDATDGKGVDIVIEMLANVNLNADLEILAPQGRVVIVGSRGSTKIDPRSMMGPETCIVGVALLNSTDAEWKITTDAILEEIRRGTIKPVIDTRYPLKEAPTAHYDIIHSKGAKGKLILHP